VAEEERRGGQEGRTAGRDRDGQGRGRGFGPRRRRPDHRRRRRRDRHPGPEDRLRLGFGGRRGPRRCSGSGRRGAGQHRIGPGFGRQERRPVAGRPARGRRKQPGPQGHRRHGPQGQHHQGRRHRRYRPGLCASAGPRSRRPGRAPRPGPARGAGEDDAPASDNRPPSEGIAEHGRPADHLQRGGHDQHHGPARPVQGRLREAPRREAGLHVLLHQGGGRGPA